MRRPLLCLLFVVAGCASSSSLSRSPSTLPVPTFVGVWVTEGVTAKHPPTLEMREDGTFAARVYDESGKIEKETVGTWSVDQESSVVVAEFRAIDFKTSGTAQLIGRERLSMMVMPSVAATATTQPERLLLHRSH